MLLVEITGCICIDTVSDQEFTHIFREFLISSCLVHTVECKDTSITLQVKQRVSLCKTEALIDAILERHTNHGPFMHGHCLCLALPWVSKKTWPCSPPPRVSKQDNLSKLPALPGSSAGFPHQEAVNNPHTITVVYRNVAPFRCR